MEVPQQLVLESNGLRFSAISMGEGTLVLFLHGFPDNHHSFEDQIRAVSRAGFRGVSVAMRGYEVQSQPADGRYDSDSLAADILGIIEALGATKAHLVGHDWGAAVAYTAAAKFSPYIISLTAMSVPHSGRFLRDVSSFPLQLWLSWYMAFFQLPRLPEWWIRRRQFSFLRWLWRRWSPGFNFPEATLLGVERTFSEPGVVEAALAYYRAAIGLNLLSPRARNEALFDVPVPTLAMTGERDRCIDADVFCALTQAGDFSGGVETRRIENAGHFLHHEQPQLVNEEIIGWLNRHEVRGQFT